MSQPSPEQLQLLQQARHANLLKIWASGRRQLTPQELAEIRHLIPAGDADAPKTFTLDPNAPLPAKLTNYYLRALREYESVYGVKERAVKRWVSSGRHAAPPDLPPLDQPALMPAWWKRRMRQEIPSTILSAASRSTGTDTPNSEAPPGAATFQPPAAGADQPSSPTSRPIDLSSMNIAESDVVKRAAQLESGTFQKLNAAYEKGDDDGIRMWQPRWEKAREAYQKAKTADLEWQKKMGKLIDYDAVVADQDEAVEMLKMMRENMVRRIEEKLPPIDPQVWEKIKNVILDVRTKEDLLFADMPSLRRNEIQTLLAAA